MVICKEVVKSYPDNTNEKESNLFTVVLMIVAMGILPAGGIWLQRFRGSGHTISTVKIGLDAMKDILVNQIPETV